MILATSANGSSDFGSGEIYFSDGTSQSYNFFTVNDWFDPKNNVAVKVFILLKEATMPSMKEISDYTKIN